MEENWSTIYPLEKIILICFVVLSLLLFLVQFCIAYNYIQASELLDGQIIKEYEFFQPVQDIELKSFLVVKLKTPYIPSLPQGKIYINDQFIACLTNINKKIPVQPGDKVEIDVSDYLLPLTFVLEGSQDFSIKNKLIKIPAKGRKSIFIPEK